MQDLQVRLSQARVVEDQALLELRVLKARTSNEPQFLAEQFVKDFRNDADRRLADVIDQASLAEFSEWIWNASKLWSQQLCQYLEGDVKQLALAEIELIAATGKAAALLQIFVQPAEDYSEYDFALTA
jgi:hypothetical protein